MADFPGALSPAAITGLRTRVPMAQRSLQGGTAASGSDGSGVPGGGTTPVIPAVPTVGQLWPRTR